MRVLLSLIIGMVTFASVNVEQGSPGPSDLFTACRAKDKDMVQRCLDGGADVNAVDEVGLTPLFYALHNGNPEITDLLLAHGANVDVKDPRGIDLICDVASGGNFELFKKVAGKGLDIHKRYKLEDEYTGTLLHAAIRGDNVKIAEYLLDNGLDIEGRDSNGYSALFLAATFDNPEMAKFLVGKGAYIYACSYYKNEFDIDTWRESGVVIDYLREVAKEKSSLPKEGLPSWRSFISGSPAYHFDVDIKGLEAFIAGGGSVTGKDEFGNTLLHYVAGAVEAEKSDILIRLVEDFGFDVNVVNVYGETPLHNAAHYDMVENVRNLLAYGGDVHARDKEGNTALLWMANASFNGDPSGKDEFEITKMLLAAGADVNAQNVFGHTVLYRFSDNYDGRHTGLMQFLLDHGADVHHRANNGETPLHEATATVSVKIMKLLLEAGADPRALNIYNKTPLQTTYRKQEAMDLIFDYINDASLFEAVYYCQAGLVKKLVADGADIETIFEKKGSPTALIFATENNEKVMVEMLLSLKANINAQDSLGYASVHYAAEEGYIDLLYCLLEAGADVSLKNKDGRTALDLAVAKNQLRSVQMIKDFHPNLAATPVDTAVKGDKPAVVEDSSGAAVAETMSEEQQKALVKKQLLERIQKPFHKLIVQGDIKAVDKMFEDGDVDLDEFDNVDSSPLMYAVYFGYTDIVKFLLDHGAATDNQNQQGLTVLHIAVFAGNKDMVVLLLASGADASLRTADGMNVLEAAKVTGREDLAELITKASPGLTVDMSKFGIISGSESEDSGLSWERKELVSKSGNPFHIAVIKGQQDEVAKMLEAGSNANEMDKVGRLAIGYAACMKDKEMVKLLIQHGAEINRLDDNIEFGSWTHMEGSAAGSGVLHYLVRSGDIEMLEFMVGLGAEVNVADEEHGKTPAFLAFELDKFDVLEALVKAGADVNFRDERRGRTIFHCAASNDSIKWLKQIRTLGDIDIESPDKKGRTALMLASDSGADDALTYLLAQGANINATDNEGNNALDAIFSSQVSDVDHVEVVRVLLEYGIDVNHKNNKGNPPLFCMFDTYREVKPWFWDCITLLIEQGADMTIRNNKGDTLLHIAANSRSLQLAKLALEKGISIDVENNLGQTPLYQAVNSYGFCESDPIELIKLLFSEKTDLAQVNEHKQTLLHAAAGKGWPQVTAFFIESGIDVNVRSKGYDSVTPLHLAAETHGLPTEKHKAETVKILLEHGADVNAKDVYDKTAMDYAYDNSEIVELLKGAGAIK